MPDLQPSTLADLHVVSELIRAYLPQCVIRIEPLREVMVQNKKLTRPDVQRATDDHGERIRQISSKAFHGARLAVDEAIAETASRGHLPASPAISHALADPPSSRLLSLAVQLLLPLIVLTGAPT